MELHSLIKWKPKFNSLKNPSVFRFFSTSDSKDKPQTLAAAELDVSSSPEPATKTRSQSSFPSIFSELKANLENQQQQSQPNSQSSQFRRSTSPSFTSTSTLHNKSTPNLDQIREKLSNFRHPSDVSPADSDVTSYSSTSESPSLKHEPQEISLQELYKRNVSEKSDVSKENGQMSPGKVGESLSFDGIRLTLRKSALGAQNERRNVNVDRMSWLSVRNSFNLKHSDADQDSKVVGGKDTLPTSNFGRQMIEKKEGEYYAAMKTELLGMYNLKQLGQRLKELRPEVKEGNWFSIQELSERLSKLKEEEKKKKTDSGNSRIQGLKNAFISLIDMKTEGSKRSPLQRFDIHGLGQMGRTPDFKRKPPKEHLVEMYFHPDNMSSAEKLKIELTKVREEFKMSESDCGSARVQVAQLTTKIKHLSSVLHKKDKHSRKGLEEMVQRRKKLLKYLRRTDWDSYCFVISTLGLRDNPISRA